MAGLEAPAGWSGSLVTVLAVSWRLLKRRRSQASRRPSLSPSITLMGKRILKTAWGNRTLNTAENAAHREQDAEHSWKLREQDLSKSEESAHMEKNAEHCWKLWKEDAEHCW